MCSLLPMLIQRYGKIEFSKAGNARRCQQYLGILVQCMTIPIDIRIFMAASKMDAVNIELNASKRPMDFHLSISCLLYNTFFCAVPQLGVLVF